MGSHSVYLPPSRGDIPAVTPAEAGTRLSDSGGMQGRVDLLPQRHSVQHAVTGYPAHFWRLVVPSVL